MVLGAHDDLVAERLDECGHLLGSAAVARSAKESAIVALCPEVDVASQGDSVTEARRNLEEALTLFFETASAEEIDGCRPLPMSCA